MGVRLYSPTLGRFRSVDSIVGGNANAYVYPTDPVNNFDLDGLCVACHVPHPVHLPTQQVKHIKHKKSSYAIGVEGERIGRGMAEQAWRNQNVDFQPHFRVPTCCGLRIIDLAVFVKRSKAKHGYEFKANGAGRNKDQEKKDNWLNHNGWHMHLIKNIRVDPYWYECVPAYLCYA